MAARRLVVVMLVLLVISTVAAALAPVPPPEGTETTSTATSPPPPLTPVGGEFVSARFAPGEGRKRLKLQAGDQLRLEVETASAQTLELTGTGLTDNAAPGAPARFDVLLRRPGHYTVQPLGRPTEPVGVVVVSEREPTRPD